MSATTSTSSATSSGCAEMWWRFIPAYADDTVIRVEFFGDEIDRISEINAADRRAEGRGAARGHLSRLPLYCAQGKDAARPSRRSRRRWRPGRIFRSRRANCWRPSAFASAPRYDIEMLQEIGFCKGIENYSRVLSGRAPGSTPCTLLDYFPEDFLLFVDESHVTLPQVRGMYRRGLCPQKDAWWITASACPALLITGR